MNVRPLAWQVLQECCHREIPFLLTGVSALDAYGEHGLTRLIDNLADPGTPGVSLQLVIPADERLHEAIYQMAEAVGLWVGDGRPLRGHVTLGADWVTVSGAGNEAISIEFRAPERFRAERANAVEAGIKDAVVVLLESPAKVAATVRTMLTLVPYNRIAPTEGSMAIGRLGGSRIRGQPRG